MLWQDFDQFFVIVDICHIDDNANYFYKEMPFAKGEPRYFDFFSTGGNLTLALSQLSRRYHRSKQHSEKLAQSTIIVGRETGENTYEYVDSKVSLTSSELYMELCDL